MSKTIPFLFFHLLFCSLTHGQLSKGNTVIGLNFKLSHQIFDPVKSGNFNSYSVAPSFAKLFIKNAVAGVMTSIGFDKNSDNTITRNANLGTTYKKQSKEHGRSLGLSLFTQHHYAFHKKFSIFIQSEVSFTHSRRFMSVNSETITNSNEKTYDSYENNYKRNSYEIFVSPGLSYYITPSWAISTKVFKVGLSAITTSDIAKSSPPTDLYTKAGFLTNMRFLQFSVNYFIKPNSKN